jgi:hypothetical protein
VSLPIGAVLQANVATMGESVAASIFPSFVTHRTSEMSTNLVIYFNHLPFRLPGFAGPPGTPTPRQAVQTYIYEQLVSNPMSLTALLLGVPLPGTTGADLQLYDATVMSILDQSRQQLIEGVRQVFTGQILVGAPPNGTFI